MRLPPRSSWDAEDTIPVDTEVESGPLTTFFGPLVDLTVDDVPEVDTSHLGATMSMLQEVLRSVESLAVPSGSGGVPSSMLAGGTLALVDVTKADEVGALEPQIVKNAKGPMLELPSEFEFRRAIQSFQSSKECSGTPRAKRFHATVGAIGARVQPSHRVLEGP
uniref:Uncharacterized protein n=1 Tax=Setaria viridis TaxID=4556 RepID=A0A4U6UJS4_SETVI|nr:hypothetical protein SEVIR_5G170100v2 [Setaria viridis]TKW14465.1 hypothetical protein SEVIR_5G170100v2 [Setaria viridis]